MGVTQNFGSNLLGSFAAPVLLVAFATAFGWRNAFFLAGVPGLITAGLLWWLIKEEKPALGRTGPDRISTRGAYAEILKSRNMLLCAIISVLLVSYLVICWAFLPLYLTQVRQFSPQTMGWLMGTLGISATITSFVVPGLSDWIGRKRVMIIVPLIGVILPLGAIYFCRLGLDPRHDVFCRLGARGLFPYVHGDHPVGIRESTKRGNGHGICHGNR
jgi:predicted MFS family arabinose efflux permease